MDSALLVRILKIAATTGERHVIVDAALPEPVVILPLSAYERLAGGGGPAKRSTEPLPPPPSEWSEPAWAESQPTPQKIRENRAEGAPAAGEEDRFYLEPIE